MGPDGRSTGSPCVLQTAEQRAARGERVAALERDHASGKYASAGGVGVAVSGGRRGLAYVLCFCARASACWAMPPAPPKKTLLLGHGHGSVQRGPIPNHHGHNGLQRRQRRRDCAQGHQGLGCASHGFLPCAASEQRGCFWPVVGMTPIVRVAGTNEKALIRIFGRRTQAERNVIRQSYSRM
jgi:hypothetical protein